MKKVVLCAVAAVIPALSLMAQSDGYVSGGFETNTIYYVQDDANASMVPEGNMGSNNYLKVDFGKGNLEGGIQAEHYMPSLIGYPSQLNGFYLSNKYIRLRDAGFSVTFGDFYEQFGSGLLFRAYEDRSLGLNTAVQGIHLAYSYNDVVSAKALIGTPKLYMTYSDVSRVAGADLSVNLARAVGIESLNFALEGSFFGKFQAIETDAEIAEGKTPDVNGYSARAVFDWNNLTLKGEFITRDADVSAYNHYETARSQAILAEAAYTMGGLGVNLTFRKLGNMTYQSDRNQTTMFTQLNYIPALTQQHSYSLAALNPYVTQPGGETAAQADVYYFFPRKTLLGGIKGMRAHFNFSTAYGPRENAELTAALGDEFYYRDLTMDVERWWGKKIKTIFLYTWQTSNNRIGVHPSNEVWTSHTVVADATYKFNQKHSLRAEYQHLWTMNDQGNWMSLAAEYTISPGWSFSVADMWNYGMTGTHYFNGGASYSHSRTRYALNFGRFRQGMQCSGGVCRMIPAYTGANLSITTSF